MLDAAIKAQLTAYLERCNARLNWLPALDDSAKQRRKCASLLADIATLSRTRSACARTTNAARPIVSPSAQPGETAAHPLSPAYPMGHEFTSLVLALLQTGGHPPKVDAGRHRSRSRPCRVAFNFETFISLSCHNCPDVVQALNLMAVLNPGVTSTMIDGALVPGLEVKRRQIMAVPTTWSI
jgi:alkyl hydroperoxide reductase subunit F